MKVPMSDSADDDDASAASAAAAAKSQLSPSKSASGAREKTFLSEVDLQELKPAEFESAGGSSSHAKVISTQSKREEIEAELAKSEAAAGFKPRAEWPTESHADRAPTEVFCCTWSPDSRFLAAGCGDGSIRVFNASTGRVAYMLRSSATMALGSSTSAAATSSSSSSHATGGYAGSHIEESLPITCIRFRPTPDDTKTKGVLIATCADGTVTHWHMMSQTCLYSIQEVQDPPGEAQTYSCDYAPDGESFATGGRDGKVRVYDESTKALSATLHAGKDKGTTGHSNRVYSVKYNPRDPNILVSGSWDNTVQIWDISLGYSIRSIYGPHICGDALDLSLDGRTILTGSWRPNQALQRWDLESGKLVDTIPFAAGPGGLGGDRPELLYAAAFAPDGRSFAAGGCGTNEAKVFTLGPSGNDPPKVVDRISAGKGGVYCLAFAPSGKKMAVGGGGPNVIVVDV